MRILIFTPTLGVGGAEQLVVAYARGLRDRGHVVCVAFGYLETRRPELDGEGIRTAMLSHRLLRPNTVGVYAWALRAQTRRFRPDVIYAHSVTASLVTRLAAPRTPSLVTIHGIDTADQRRAAAILRLTATRVTAVSDATADGIRRHPGAPPIDVITPSVDVADIDARSAGPPDPVPVGDPSFLVAARHVHQKGIDVLLRAFPLVLEALPEAHLTTVGPDSEDFETMVEALGLSRSVTLAGPRLNVLPSLLHADVVVLPSRWEGLPVVALESLALRRPFVATRVDGTPAVVRHGETGWLCDPEDERSLAAAMIAAGQDPEEGRRRGEAGRNLVLGGYSHRVALDRLEALFRSLRTGGADAASQPLQACAVNGAARADEGPQDPGVVIDVVRDAAGLAALGADWDRLVRGMPRPSPFLLHDWVTTWWRHYGAGATPAIVTARVDGELLGLAPLYVRRRRGLRVCRLLGDHESALGDLVVAPGAPEAVGRRLVEAVTTLPFDYLDAFGMPAGSVLHRDSAPGALTFLERVEAPVLLMPDGWAAAYAAKTGAKKRNLHRRRLRQLGELGVVRWDLAGTPDEIAAALEPAFLIHARRWEGRPDGSTFGTEEGRAFHREAGAAMARIDAVRLLTLSIDDRPVAFHYSFKLDRTMYVHRLAFDPDLAKYSPGQMTLLRAIEEASGEGVTRVEFLGGDERYKLELADLVEPLHQAIGLAQNPLGWAAVQGTVSVIEARKRLKRSATVKRAYDRGLAPARRLRARLSGRGDA